MKRTLKLNLETLRTLDNGLLGSARGGYASEACPLSNLCVTNITRQTTTETLGPDCIAINYTRVCA